MSDSEKPGALPRRPDSLKNLSSPKSAAAPSPATESFETASLKSRLTRAEEELATLSGLRDSYGRLVDLLSEFGDLLLEDDAPGQIRRVLELSLRLVGADRAAFFRLDPKGSLRQAQSLPSGQKLESISRSLVRDALMERKSRYYLGEDSWSGLERESILYLELGTVVVTPLLAEDRLLGVLYLDGKGVGHFGSRELPLLESFARLAASAMLRLDELQQARKEGRRLESENRELRETLGEDTRFGRMIASSPAMKRVVSQLRRMAALRSTVILEGETGTGKEVIARALHVESPWQDKPFVAINCGAIPENLLESELFGHARGAFTGADRDRVGLFEQADGGTLLLDEIGDMPLSLQVKLLRVLEEGEFRRLGESRLRKPVFRLIVASHRNLEKRVLDGKFREDLYYRLNVLSVRIPPLRERPDDILALSLHFLERQSAEQGCPVPRLEASSLKLLQSQPWPGNVRQLEKCIERSLALFAGGEALAPGDLLLDEGPLSRPANSGSGDLRSRLQDLEFRIIQEALDQCGGQVSSAARTLGISRQTLHEKLRKQKKRDESL